ncbi:MAG TPA: nitroreductase/quinone reductase family protein [Solirubrobacteraceae bacterium]|nr:nitroreductase/quinone reductase family protein [Solirubrobacteraceae bacterium]
MPDPPATGPPAATTPSASTKDRPVKRRVEILAGRYTLNPLIRSLFRVGVALPGMAIIETVGRRTGQVRRTPVVCSRAGGELWLIAQHGAHAGWVRNFEASPAVRVKLGRRWLAGTAQLVPDDDVRARIATFADTGLGRTMTAAMFRALESQPVSVRIELA